MDTIDKRLNKLVQDLKPTAKYSPELNLIDDLQVDSLDLIDFFFEVEQEFKIHISDTAMENNDLYSLSNLRKYVEENTSSETVQACE